MQKKMTMSKLNSIREERKTAKWGVENNEKKGRDRKVMFGKDLLKWQKRMIAGLCLMIVRGYTDLTVTRWGLQIGLWHVRGAVVYCSDGLNGN
jgi:hypothetical protein